ncbi:MAG: hypothetical protein L0228_09100 [Planctomycetes bacterium]|nr:hypothetical protein [Planctomycetota bacterium]
MATTQYRAQDEFDQQEPPAKRRNWMTGCLLGCLAVIVVLLVLGTVATIWISRNWRDWVSTAASQGVKQAIDESDLPAEEKDQIKVQVDRVAVAFREGRLSNEQAARLMEKLTQSPLITAFVASAAEKKYLDGSGLSDEEKAEAKVTLQRFLRGAIDEKIDRRSIDAALGHVADKQPDGNWRFRNKVSDEELRAFLAEAKKAADDAQIPDQPAEFDPSDEVKRIIDESMSEPAAAPPASDAAPGA